MEPNQNQQDTQQNQQANNGAQVQTEIQPNNKDHSPSTSQSQQQPHQAHINGIPISLSGQQGIPTITFASQPQAFPFNIQPMPNQYNLQQLFSSQGAPVFMPGNINMPPALNSPFMQMPTMPSGISPNADQRATSIQIAPWNFVPPLWNTGYPPQALSTASNQYFIRDPTQPNRFIQISAPTPAPIQPPTTEQTQSIQNVQQPTNKQLPKLVNILPLPEGYQSSKNGSGIATADTELGKSPNKVRPRYNKSVDNTGIARSSNYLNMVPPPLAASSNLSNKGMLPIISSPSSQQVVVTSSDKQTVEGQNMSAILSNLQRYFQEKSQNVHADQKPLPKRAVVSQCPMNPLVSLNSGINNNHLAGNLGLINNNLIRATHPVPLVPIYNQLLPSNQNPINSNTVPDNDLKKSLATNDSQSKLSSSLIPPVLSYLVTDGATAVETSPAKNNKVAGKSNDLESLNQKNNTTAQNHRKAIESNEKNDQESVKEQNDQEKSDSVNQNSKSKLVNNTVISDPLPMTILDYNKLDPPKAIVKPQVLTHILDGFLIQEASEPFPIASLSKETKIDEKENLEFPASKRFKFASDYYTLHADEISQLEQCAVCNSALNENNVTIVNNKKFCSQSCAEKLSASNVVQLNPASESDKELNKNSQVPNALSFCGTPSENNPITWTIDKVCEFIRKLPGCADLADDFAEHEIDGQALLLIKPDHLISLMNIKLGLALKICAEIDSLKLQPE